MYVLDTNVISEVIRPQPDAGVMTWLVSTPRKILFLASPVVAELYFGIERVPEGKKKAALLEFIDAFVAAGGPANILSFGEDEARAYARIGAYRAEIGKAISQLDAQTAAIASVRRLPVVTRNVRHFEHCGIGIINPWEPQ